MKLTELTHDDNLALVALVEVVVSSDARVSDDEQTHDRAFAGVRPFASARVCLGG